MSGRVPCRCGDSECDRMECPVCGCSDCKWPSECYGKCSECGAPTKPMSIGGSEPLDRSDGLGLWMFVHCSQSCADADRARAESEGRIIKVSDVTPERFNELLNTAGLKLAKTGKVTLS